MSLVLEDGSVVDGANSYADEDMADTYCEDRLMTAWTSATTGKEEALIRATQAIDAKYVGRFPGYKTSGRDQNLEWPRAAAYDAQGWLIRDNEIPTEVIEATIEAAVRELAVPNSMMPDLARGGMIESLRAGSVGITYSANASAKTTFTLIDGILSNVLNGTQSSGGGIFGTAVRG